MYKTKLSEIEKQLSTAVINNIFDTKSALGLLLKSTTDITSIHDNLKSIQKKCKTTKGLLKEFDKIKKMSLARSNLKITTRIQTLFQRIPETANELLNLLKQENCDRYLKEVYIKLKKLIKLREKAIKNGQQFLKDTEKTMNEHFKLIGKVATILEKRIRINIQDTLYLACEEPEILIQTLIICELDDKLKDERILVHNKTDWRNWRIQEQERYNNNENDEDKESKDDDKDSSDYFEKKKIKNKQTMKDKAINEILESIATLIGQSGNNNNNNKQNHDNNDDTNNTKEEEAKSIKPFLDKIGMLYLLKP